MNSETKKLLDELGVDSKDESGENELEELRREKETRANLEKELELLKPLFPELSVEDIPDSVFTETENGKGLAANYALFYLKREKEKAEMQKKNEENSRSAPPDIKESEEEVYFTPEAVRAMSENEVRRNYKEIMKSMEKWSK